MCVCSVSALDERHWEDPDKTVEFLFFCDPHRAKEACMKREAKRQQH